MFQSVDYYAILGVPDDVDLDTLKSVYRQLARTFHPDVNAEASAAEHFRRITEAYLVLSDPEQRALFDRDRSRPARPRHARARARKRRQVGTEINGEASLRVVGIDLGGLVGISFHVRTRPLFSDDQSEEERALPAGWPLDPHPH
jgi:curved DNA-binding protein CbpA